MVGFSNLKNKIRFTKYKELFFTNTCLFYGFARKYINVIIIINRGNTLINEVKQ